MRVLTASSLEGILDDLGEWVFGVSVIISTRPSVNKPYFDVIRLKSVLYCLGYRFEVSCRSWCHGVYQSHPFPIERQEK